MNITLENWLRNKLQETEEMLCYDLATDTLRCWIDEYNELLIKPDEWTEYLH
jgi:hypothetical protein